MLKNSYEKCLWCLLLVSFAFDPSQSLRIFNPLNYLDQLPTLSLPYINNLKIPSMPLIRPTPSSTTKVISVVTKYVYNSPVCIKSTSKKPICKPAVPTKVAARPKEFPEEEDLAEFAFAEPVEVEERERKYLAEAAEERQVRQLKLFFAGKQLEKSKNESKSDATVLEPSESLRVTVKRDVGAKTPPLNGTRVRDLLIEDRLDKLEEILPHYTRLRAYQTSTITVTRTRTNRMITATLMVKNCIPQGIQYCQPLKKRKSPVRRKSKVAVEQSDAQFPHYFG